MLEKQARIRWQCRRGMLELDAILQPFFDRYYATLSHEQQQQFEYLLTFPDQDLFSWFIGSQQPKEETLQVMVALIKSYPLYLPE